MIVVDSSALIAILYREPEADAFVRIIIAAEICLMSAVSLLESSMVMAERRGGEADWMELDEFVSGVGIQVIPHDQTLAWEARQAFLRFGKGRHPAALNMGDCASYALAKFRGLPLLFKGNDFVATDIGIAA